jgi:hypothetical protein
LKRRQQGRRSRPTHPLALAQVLSPQGDQMWQQQNTQHEVHFNIAARGPGSYKVW